MLPRVLQSTLLLALPLVMVSAALAQEPVVSNDKSSWVLGYALTIMGIVLGLLAVCRPGNRSAEVRVDDE